MPHAKLRPLVVTATTLVAAAAFPLVGPAGSARAASGPVSDLAWSSPDPATSPPPLTDAAGAYDAANSTFVLFGGVTASGTLSQGTWVWNGHDWTNPTDAGPTARELASMAYDPALDELILFGGQDSDGSLQSDTWAWNGQSWSQLQPPASPPARDGASLAYDSDGDLLLFGGTGYSAGSGMTPPTTTGSGGTGDSGGGSADQPATETPLSDSWAWEGAASGWVQVDTTGVSPPARTGAVEAYDRQNGTTVLFGGESAPATLISPPSLLDDTWIWADNAWTRAKPAASPPARFGAVADTFPPLAGLLVTGGRGASGDLSDSWVWQGSTWSAMKQSGSYPTSEESVGGFDSATVTFVEFGGVSGDRPLDDTSTAVLTTPGQATTTTSTTLKPAPPTTLPSKPPTTTAVKPGRPRKTTTTTVHRTTPTTVAGFAPPSVPKIEASSSRIPRGGEIELDGTGFNAGLTVTVTFHSKAQMLGHTTANPGGGFVLDVWVPSDASPGQHHIVATAVTSSGSVVSATTAVEVYSATKALSRGSKAFLLGLSLLIPLATYLVMVVYGVWTGRRRNGRIKGPGSARLSPS